MNRFFSTGPVDVFHFSLQATGEEETELLASLDPHEADRARGLVNSRDRRRFAVGRGRLRSKLGERLGIHACDIRFEYGPFGKPKIDPRQSRGRAIHFNLAHSNELALLALSEGGPVGVDVERVLAFPAMERVARRVFSPSEYEDWSRLSVSSREYHFFSVWTRKEAVLKLFGQGLNLPPEIVEVGLEGACGPVDTLVIDRERRTDLSVTTFGLSEGYLGALALEIPTMDLDGAQAGRGSAWSDKSKAFV